VRGIEYRRAQSRLDFEQMTEIQAENLLSVLGPDQLSSGFLNTAFTVEQFEAMDESIAVIVALDHNKVCGYFCAATLDFFKQFPYPAGLVSQASKLSYKDKALSDYRCCIVNPICIDKDHRGGEIFSELCRSMIPIIAKDYEVALAFISTKNEKSFNCCKQLMEVLGKFQVKDHEFWVLIYDLHRRDNS